MNTPNIQISNKTSYSIDSFSFTDILTQIASNERQLTGKEISICLVNAKEIRYLNKKFFGRDSVTDILTFKSEFPNLPYLGELIINLDGVVSRKGNYSEDLKKLFIHGVLHLLDYDHINTEAKQRMEAREAELLQLVKLRELEV